MNRYAAAVLALSAAAFGGQALAESPIALPQEPFVSSKDRAEVQAELNQFKKSGVNPWSTTAYNPVRNFKSTASRQDVTAQYIAAREEVAAFGREDSGAAYMARNGHSAPASTTMAGQPASNVR